MSLAVIACGSRDWTKSGIVNATLTGLMAIHSPLVLIEGKARGADRVASDWARTAGDAVEHLSFPAAWAEHHADWCPGAWCQGRRYCVAAGPRRNQHMLDELLCRRSAGWRTLVVAFKDGFDYTLAKGGTEDMVQRASTAGVPAYVVGSVS